MDSDRRTELNGFDVWVDWMDKKENTIPSFLLKGAIGVNGTDRDWANSAGDLLQKMLACNPKERCTAVQVLDHPWCSWELTDELRQTARDDITKRVQGAKSGWTQRWPVSGPTDRGPEEAVEQALRQLPTSTGQPGSVGCTSTYTFLAGTFSNVPELVQELLDLTEKDNRDLSAWFLISEGLSPPGEPPRLYSALPKRAATAPGEQREISTECIQCLLSEADPSQDRTQSFLDAIQRVREAKTVIRSSFVSEIVVPLRVYSSKPTQVTAQCVVTAQGVASHVWRLHVKYQEVSEAWMYLPLKFSSDSKQAGPWREQIEHSLARLRGQLSFVAMQLMGRELHNDWASTVSFEVSAEKQLKLTYASSRSLPTISVSEHTPAEAALRLEWAVYTWKNTKTEDSKKILLEEIKILHGGADAQWQDGTSVVRALNQHTGNCAARDVACNALMDGLEVILLHHPHCGASLCLDQSDYVSDSSTYLYLKSRDSRPKRLAALFLSGWKKEKEPRFTTVLNQWCDLIVKCPRPGIPDEWLDPSDSSAGGNVRAIFPEDWGNAKAAHGHSWKWIV